MNRTWCPTCKKEVTCSLDSFPARCGDCCEPYLVDQMTTWRRRNTLFGAAADLFAACEIAVARLEIDHQAGTYDCTCAPDDLCELHRLRAAIKKARGEP